MTIKQFKLTAFFGAAGGEPYIVYSDPGSLENFLEDAKMFYLGAQAEADDRLADEPDEIED